jgi:hypothetical protein
MDRLHKTRLGKTISILTRSYKNLTEMSLKELCLRFMIRFIMDLFDKTSQLVQYSKH